jgi:hypothetical protein
MLSSFLFVLRRRYNGRPPNTQQGEHDDIAAGVLLKYSNRDSISRHKKRDCVHKL